jgi:hypothetical protein
MIDSPTERFHEVKVEKFGSGNGANTKGKYWFIAIFLKKRAFKVDFDRAV